MRSGEIGGFGLGTVKGLVSCAGPPSGEFRQARHRWYI